MTKRTKIVLGASSVIALLITFLAGFETSRIIYHNYMVENLIEEREIYNIKQLDLIRSENAYADQILAEHRKVMEKLTAK